MNPNYVAAALALGFVAWVALSPRRAQAEAITTDDGEGTGLDVGGLLNQAATEAEAVFTPADNWANPSGLSDDGLIALMRREGFSATPYPDHKGYSIGYGHLIKPGESFERVTRAEAADLLATDVAWAVDAVRSAVLVPVNQAQFDALVSFAYNVGAGAFRGSTLVRKLNARDPTAVDEFGRWVYASGVVNPGLQARRADEVEQFNA